MKPLRIGWLYQDLNPGGGQRVCIEISRELIKRGYDVSIIVPKGRTGGRKIEGVKILERGPRFNSPMISILSSIPAMFLISKGFDVVISSMPFMAIINAWSFNRALKYHWVQIDDVCLFDDHSLIKSPTLLNAYKKTAKYSYHLPLHYIVNSEWTKRKFESDGGKEAVVIHPGVDTNIFKPLKSAKKNDLIIGTIGRRVRFKGLDDLISALKIVFHSGFKFHLRIITQESLNIPELPFLYEIVSPADDTSLARLISGCDIFISASWFEGFALPPLEAMACGVPVITTDSGGVREYAEDGVNCLMTPPKSPEKIAEAVKRLISDEELRTALSVNGRKTAVNNTWVKTVDRLEEFIFNNSRI